MNYAERNPAPPLSSYIERLWYYDSLDLPHSRERVLPDGGFELIINLQDVPRKLFNRHDPTRYDLFHRGWMSGAHWQHLVIDVLRGSSMIGAHFRPGGAAPFMGMPADELASKVVDLEAVWGSAAWSLRDRLLETRTATGKLSLLEAALRKRFKQTQHDHSRRGRLAIAVKQLDASPSRVPLICQELGISQKHFIEQFRAEVGLTPKRFSRIRRFQKALAQIGSKSEVDWSDVAFECGYYDQSHFINDFQAFCGVSPSVYLGQRLDYPNFTRAD